MADEDWRAAGEACAVLLATAGGRTYDAAAVRGDARLDCCAPDTERIENWRVRSAAKFGRQQVGDGEALQEWRNIAKCCGAGADRRPLGASI